MSKLNELNIFLLKYNLQKYKLTLLRDGISNTNYSLGKKYALKVPYDDRFINLKPYQIELQKIASQNFISPDVLFWDTKRGFLITELIQNYSPISELDITLSQAKKIIEVMKIYEKLDVSNIEVPELNYRKMLGDYRLKVNPKDRIYLRKLEYSKILDKNTTLSHFDMVNNNLLSDKNSNIQLIDFEFACIAPKYFDLVSLLSENKFPENKKELLINEYFKNDEKGLREFLDKKDEMQAILDLLWYHWALARSDVKNERYKNIYIEIAKDKKTSLSRYVHAY